MNPALSGVSFALGKMCFSDGLAPFFKQEKWGYIDDSGAEQIPPTYDDCGPFLSGRAFVRIKEHWFIINRRNEQVGSLRFQQGYSFSRDGVAAVKIGRKWGYVDLAGTMKIPAIFDGAQSFSEGRGAVQVIGKGWKFIDLTGGDCSEYFGCAYPFSSVLAPVRKNGKWGYIRLDGKTAIPATFLMPSQFRDGRALAATAKSLVVIDKTGKITAVFGEMPLQPTSLLPFFAEDLCWLSDISRHVCCYGIDGKETLSSRYLDGKRFTEGIAAVKNEDGKWGYIDKQGTATLGFDYDGATPFSEGKAAVLCDGKVAYVTKDKAIVWQEDCSEIGQTEARMNASIQNALAAAIAILQKKMQIALITLVAGCTLLNGLLVASLLKPKSPFGESKRSTPIPAE